MSTAHDGRRLVISHLVRPDAGVYSCLFKNSVAQVSHAVRLVVEGMRFSETAGEFPFPTCYKK